jgi:hypothetical protein
MRTFVATLCLAVVFADEAADKKAALTKKCAEATMARGKECAKAETDKKMDCVAASVKCSKACLEGKECAKSSASTLLAGAAAIATMAALF